MKLALVLVNYNGKKYNSACIDSLLQNKVQGELLILVVDNTSSDGSVELLRQRYGELSGTTREFIILDQNYSFAAANNRGIERAGEMEDDYVLLLNNDAEASLQSFVKSAMTD